MDGYIALKRERKDVKHVSANYTLQEHLDECLNFDNYGASGEVTITLLPAKIGMRHKFDVKVAHLLSIAPASGEQIALPATGAYATADTKLKANAIGENVVLECLVTGKWACTDYIGTWTDDGAPDA